MPRVCEVHFEDNGLSSLGCIDQMVSAGFGAGNSQLTGLNVGTSNPAASLTLLRAYAAHRLPSLDVVNGAVGQVDIALRAPGLSPLA